MKIQGTIRVQRTDNTTFIGWAYDEEYYLEDGSIVIDTSPNLTAEELAYHLDAEAENANYHSLVGVHEYLYKLISKYTDSGTVQKIFDAIAKRGGLHEAF